MMLSRKSVLSHLPLVYCSSLSLSLCSGTEKQHVADDYAKRLHAGQVECTQLMHEALNKLATKPGSPSLQLQSCEYLNISVCPATETNSVS